MQPHDRSPALLTTPQMLAAMRSRRPLSSPAARRGRPGPALRWLALAAVLLSACGEDPTPAADAGGGDVSAVERLCRARHTPACAARVSCCPGAGHNVDTCLSAAVAGCTKQRAGLQDAVDQGHVRVDSAALERLTTLETAAVASCGQHADPSAHGLWRAQAFQAAMVDTASVGAPCAAGAPGIACAEGQGWCAPVPGGPGCVARGAAAAACSSSQPLACGDGLQCVAGSCSAPGSAGQPCDDGRPCAATLRCVGGSCQASATLGAQCQGDGHCGPDLWCDGGTCAELPPPTSRSCAKGEACPVGSQCVTKWDKPRCAKPAAVGMPCEVTPMCDTGLHCSGGLCTELAGAGGSCTTSEGCAYNMVCLPLTKTCTPLPGAGKPCVMGFPQCQAGLSCFTKKKGEGTCIEPVGQGAECTMHANCKSGFGCDFKSGTCVALPATGKPCFDGYLCSAGWCDAGTCKAFVAAGASCSKGTECGPNATCLGDAGATSCQPVPGLDQPCLLRCQAGLLCAKVAVGQVCAPRVCLQGG